MDGFSGIEGSFGARANPGVDKNTFTCERHSDTAAVKFCNDHEAIVCLTCANYYHRTCPGIDDLEEIAKTEIKGKRFKQFISDLTHVIEKVSKLKRGKNEELSKLRTETNEALNAITEFRKDINWYLDKLEQKGKSYVEKRYKEIHTTISEDVEQCDTALEGLDSLKKRLDNIEDKSHRHINMKLGKARVTMAQTLCKEMKESRTRSDFIKLTIDPKIERFVLNLRWYGKHRTYLSMESPSQLPHLYAVKEDVHFDIRCKTDKHVCSIADLCQLKDDTILLIDSTNKSLKQLDVTYKVVDLCDLPGRPVAVCSLNKDGAAVLIEEETGSRIIKVKIGASFIALGESFQISERCVGLGYNNNEHFYIGTATTISTYSTSGEFMGELYRDTSGNFGRFDVSDDVRKICITDASRGLIIIDKDGEVMEAFIDDSLKGACGVCTDNGNQVFVCGSDSHNVVQLGHDNQKLGVLADQKKGLKCPLNVCFDKISSRLIVTMKSRNYIKVYQLK